LAYKVVKQSVFTDWISGCQEMNHNRLIFKRFMNGQVME